MVMLIFDIRVVHQNCICVLYFYMWKQLFVISINKQGVDSDTSVLGTNFAFLQIVCQSLKYWSWWNPGSSWYFLAHHSSIFLKKVYHKFDTLFICWCFWHFWHWVIVYTVMDITETVLRSPVYSCKALWISIGFCHAKCQFWCTIFDLQPYSIWDTCRQYF